MTLKKNFLIILLVAVLWQVGRMLWPFAGSILAAIVLGVVFFPFHQWLGRILKKRSHNFIALLSSFTTLLLFVVPLSLLVWMVTSEARKLGPIFKESQEVIQSLRDGDVSSTVPKVRDLRAWLSAKVGFTRSDFERIAARTGNAITGRISSFSGALAKRTLDLLVSVLLAWLTLFLVFKDGPAFYNRLMTYVPLETGLKSKLTEEMDNTINGVIRGWFLTAMAQGAVATVGYFIAQVPSALLLGVLTAVTGLIPSVGTGLVWLPVGVLLLSQGHTGAGTFLLLYGLLVIAVVDNFLRPYLVGNRADIPFLYLLFALLGGIKVWGIKGVIIGPLLIAVTPVLLEAFRRQRGDSPAEA